ncbi:DUF1972 domain-containing protein [Magnetospirillum fulvum]|uniref:Glycosyltransferase n=1 Tax=Magnetospirillum fulvum MGU-K5 TaxID=1316936 RepID=S9TG57_MAGFU|nr:DUF1972 domain-containing protein [Magnetospirillum fulvum]EPY01241.1 glycosyltransferase [Magnetospirillum fulvum MGU-K5]
MNISVVPQPDANRRLFILGIRGIPGGHGGFETFAEHLSLFLVGRGWAVSVYCQQDNAAPGAPIHEEEWCGVTRIVVPVVRAGSAGSIEFDWKCIRHVRHQRGTRLVLGYNTGCLIPLLRLGPDRIIVNMDGIEWKRAKWSRPVRAWFWLNEWIAAWAGTRLVADHPEIAGHLAHRVRRSKVSMIPYGAPEILDAPVEPLDGFGLHPDGYFISVCRIEPENSILTLVRAFSRRRRGVNLVIVGRFEADNSYHGAVMAAASAEVRFVGAIYDHEILNSLRFHARAYCHGHTVGGTNPSLVEALGAGNAVLAQDNRFNRWTADTGQFFFQDEESCAALIGEIIENDLAVLRARVAARHRFIEQFQLRSIHAAYERILRGTGNGGRRRSLPTAFTSVP